MNTPPLCCMKGKKKYEKLISPVTGEIKSRNDTNVIIMQHRRINFLSIIKDSFNNDAQREIILILIFKKIISHFKTRRINN